MDLIQAIRLRALRAVVQPDREYFLRRVMRWYSKTFFTPLAQVEDIPLEDLLQTFYEEEYGAMDPESLDAIKEELLRTDEERYQQILDEEADEAEMFEMGKMIAADEARKRLEAKKAKAESISDLKQQKPGLITAKEMPEMDLPVAKVRSDKAPEGISMSFVDEADFEAELEGFGRMAQPKK
jgi:hypothetical protein